ncbi:MAG TPA: hypothetical protein VG265_03185 [Gaiellaceae bacterium]|nr:hypothetical protein [Gaiellaceae bacterium]
MDAQVDARHLRAVASGGGITGELADIGVRKVREMGLHNRLSVLLQKLDSGTIQVVPG